MPVCAEKQVLPALASSWFSWYIMPCLYNFTSDISKQIRIYRGPLLRMEEMLRLCTFYIYPIKSCLEITSSQHDEHTAYHFWCCFFSSLTWAGSWDFSRTHFSSKPRYPAFSWKGFESEINIFKSYDLRQVTSSLSVPILCKNGPKRSAYLGEGCSEGEMSPVWKALSGDPSTFYTVHQRVQTAEAIVTWTNCQGRVLNEQAPAATQEAHVSHGFLFLRSITLITCRQRWMLPCGPGPTEVSLAVPVHVQDRDCVTTVASPAPVGWDSVILHLLRMSFWCNASPSQALSWLRRFIRKKCFVSISMNNGLP